MTDYKEGSLGVHFYFIYDVHTHMHTGSSRLYTSQIDL